MYDINGRTSRRRMLKAMAATGTMAVGTSFMGSAAAARHGVEFDTVVDMGTTDADPTGEKSSDDAIETAAGPRTLLEFPPGEYLVEENHQFTGLETLGFRGRGARGDVSFVAPDGLRGTWFAISDPLAPVDSPETMVGFVWENIDWDATGENQLGNVNITVTDRVHVDGLELLGDTNAVITSEEFADESTGFFEKRQGKMLYARVVTPEGTGTIRNVVAKTGGGIDSDIPKHGPIGQGRRGAFFVGPNHSGTLAFENCHIEEFGSHGIYGSAAAGPIHVKGGVWRNNDNSQIRIAGANTSIENAVIEIDPLSIPNGSPTEVDGGYRGIIGIWWQPKKRSSTGGEVKNCAIRYLSYPKHVIDSKAKPKPPNPREGITLQETDPARVVDEPALTVKNTRIQVDVDGSEAIRAVAPRPSAIPGLKAKNLRLSGSASGGQFVSVRDRDGSRIENCRIEGTGANRDGLRFIHADALVKNVRIDVSGVAVVAEDSDVETRNVRS